MNAECSARLWRLNKLDWLGTGICTKIWIAKFQGEIIMVVIYISYEEEKDINV